MNSRMITDERIDDFKDHLFENEKSEATIEKYVRDVCAFQRFSMGEEITKEKVIEYKNYLSDEGYAATSINSMIGAINSFMVFMEWNDCRVRYLKVQRQIFRPAEKELTKSEYQKLCITAERQGNIRLSMILQTICSTGIRVSELKYITCEAVEMGETTVSLKGKTRRIIISRELRKKLLKYIKDEGIKDGYVFRTRTGKMIGRTNIWREMKKLCGKAGVDSSKVFPHNLRHLFARVFYSMEKDIVKLADVLGHCSIDTTRIYIVSTGIEHRKRIERMKLVI